MLIRTGFFLLIASISLTVPASEKSVPRKLDPNISFVASGYTEISGQFRLVVTNVGWEHVSSRLRLEWLVEGKRQSWVVQKTIPITEFDNGMLSVGMLAWSSEKSQFSLSVTHTYSGEQKKFILTPLDDGKYELKEMN
jgi:hypothetical protein